MMTSSLIGGLPPVLHRLLPVPPVPAAPRSPSLSEAESRTRIATLLDAEAVMPEATRSRVFEPTGAARATLVIWHGFTNAPPQFVPVAEYLAAQGFRVMLPRMPRHGHDDLLTRDLGNLSVTELTTHVAAWVDAAAGFGQPVWTIGLSAGAILAAWAAATCEEVTRSVLAAPLVSPKALPHSLVRLAVRYPTIVPDRYLWWNPAKKADLGESPYAYPGFPLLGIVPFLHLSEALIDHEAVPNHRLERIVVLDNPCDLAIRRDSARVFAQQVFCPITEVCAEATVSIKLGWPHDFVDPYVSGTGTTEQVAAVLLACLGTSDPSAGGVLVPPLVPRQS